MLALDLEGVRVPRQCNERLLKKTSLTGIALANSQVKEEGWWVVLGNPETDELFALKRVSFGAHTTFSLSIQAAATDLQGLRLYLLCDSYLGIGPGDCSPPQFTHVRMKRSVMQQTAGQCHAGP